MQVDAVTVDVRPLRLARPESFDQPKIPLPSGGAGNGSIYAKNKQFVARLDLGARGITARSAIRLVVDPGGEESRRHSVRRAHSMQFGSGRTTDRSAHCRRPADAVDYRILGPRTPGHQPAVAVPDGLQPEGQLHLDARTRTRSRLGTSSSTSTRRCRT